MATIFQNDILVNFAYPFLLIFFILFGVLEKTQLFGEGKKQLNALVAFVIGLIVVASIFSTDIISNLTLFLSVALVIMFVVLLLWGFVFADKKEGFKPNSTMKITLGIIIGIAVIIAVLSSTSVGLGFIGNLFNQSWSEAFWSNFIFIILIAAALAIVIGQKKSS